MELIEIIGFAKGLKCTDERDRIYGVLFLAHGWQENDITVDYSLTVSEVFTQAMVSYLRFYGSIEFLDYVGSWDRDVENLKDKLPSWVPD